MECIQDGTQEAVRQRGGGPVPHEDLRGEQAHDRATQPEVRAGGRLLQAEAEQVRGHAAARVRTRHERLQQDRQAQQEPVQHGPRAARGHVHIPRARGAARPGGLAQEGRRHRGQGPGQVRLLLVIQHDRGTGGAALPQERVPGVAVGAEPDRLLEDVRQQRLQRRPHGQRLQVHPRQPRHRHRAELPLRGHRRQLPLRRVEQWGGRRGSGGHPVRQRGEAAGGGGDGGPGVGGHRRVAGLLPVLLLRRLLRRELLLRQPRPRGVGGRVRHRREGRRLLAREELVGRLLGRPRLHQDGAQPQQPLRHRHRRLLPPRLGPAMDAPRARSLAAIVRAYRRSASIIPRY